MNNEFEFWIYTRDPNYPGTLTYDRMVTYDELDKALTAYLKTAMIKSPYSGEMEPVYNQLDYCNARPESYKTLRNIPIATNVRRFISYVVEGGSEGFYFHIDVVEEFEDELKIRNIALAKTLTSDTDFALEMQSHFEKFTLQAAR